MSRNNRHMGGTRTRGGAMIRNYQDYERLMERHPGLFDDLRKDREWFEKWLRNNLHIMDAFQRYAQRLHFKGKRDTYGAQAILERIRWDSYFREADSAYKVCNDSASFMARLVMVDQPYLFGMFRTRNEAKYELHQTNLPAVQEAQADTRKQEDSGQTDLPGMSH